MERKETWDAVEEYFECIVECDINDEDCTTQCLIELKESDS